MKTIAALAIVALALLAAPTTTAQVPQGITLVPGELTAPVPYMGSAQLPVAVAVGCLSMLEGQATTVEVTATDAQSWLTVTPAEIELDPLGCLSGAGFVVGAGSVGLAVSKDAPGVEDHTLTLVASLGGSTSDPASALYTVAYHVNYTLVPDVTFPLAVNGTEASFNVVVTQASNARSMVMMEQLKTTTGTLSGPASQVYENSAGNPASKTFKFTYKAPSSDWTNATASFMAYGHYLLMDGRAGDFDAGTPMTFTFVNAAAHDDDHDEKESPAPVGALLAIGLLGLAVAVRRRQ